GGGLQLSCYQLSGQCDTHSVLCNYLLFGNAARRLAAVVSGKQSAFFHDLSEEFIHAYAFHHVLSCYRRCCTVVKDGKSTVLCSGRATNGCSGGGPIVHTGTGCERVHPFQRPSSAALCSIVIP